LLRGVPAPARLSKPRNGFRYLLSREVGSPSNAWLYYSCPVPWPRTLSSRTDLANTLATNTPAEASPVFSAPFYGKHFWRHDAYLKLSVLPPGTIPAKNFFADFLASALHEDTRYRREGANHRFWHRMGYAINGAVVTRPDEGASLTNIMPEFGPDVGRWFKRHLGFHHRFV
jgi:hypothetical protein